MVKELTGGYKIKYHANGLDKDPIEIDFTPPFRFVIYLLVVKVCHKLLNKNDSHLLALTIAEGLT